MEATTAIRNVGRAVRPPARCQRGTAQPAKKRTCRLSGNGFLNHRFRPFWGYNGNREKAEREFLCSLSNLCNHYGLSLPDCVNGVFPQYIYETWQVISQKLKAKDEQLECIIAGDNNHSAVLTTVCRYDTGRCLYYIPVRPLWYWVQTSQGQRLAELLLSLFAYLHQVVQIPFFTENGSYLGSQYQMIEDWVNDDVDGDESEKQNQLDTLYTMHNAGLKLYAQIRKPEYVERFENIVLNFNHQDNWELEWKSIAVDFLQLYQQYPHRSIFDHIHADLLYPENEDRISADQYISFYWSGNDSLTDTLFDAIDCSFQEIAYMDEPMHVQKFDRLPEMSLPDFDFENRLFELVNSLCKQLNNYDDEQCEPTI